MKKMLAALSLSILMMLEPVLAESPTSSTDLKPAEPVVVVSEVPETEAPATEAPATEAPATETPATEAPATEAPATEAPATEAPATEAPATEAPATEAPAAEAPAAEAPATEAPAVYAAGLARLERGTVLYGNSSLSVACLSLRGEAVVFAIEASENQQAVRIAFNGGAELCYAWVKADEVIRLDAAELAAYRSRNHGDDAIVYRDVVLEPVVRRSSATEEPAADPTEEPVEEPAADPTEEPVEEPAADPTEEPVEEPAADPTEEPVEEPAADPTEEPVEEPAADPTEEPVEEPAADPTEEPVEEPAADPTEEPVIPEGPVYEYIVDENGALVLDEQGNPQPIVPEGAETPVSYLRDETGALVLVDGKPVVLATLPAEAGVVATLQDQLNPERSIDVYAAWEGETLYLGSDATLIAVLHGYDNAVYTLQWQYSPDNVTWYDLEGAEEARCTLTVTEENYQYFWRIQATITGVIGQ